MELQPLKSAQPTLSNVNNTLMPYRALFIVTVDLAVLAFLLIASVIDKVSFFSSRPVPLPWSCLSKCQRYNSTDPHVAALAGTMVARDLVEVLSGRNKRVQG